ncbi:hypothetical protein HZS_3413 [Henneguya salminicola]|nr:hypothetical protein HZS_3413 [Henneguya salminicola]
MNLNLIPSNEIEKKVTPTPLCFAHARLKYIMLPPRFHLQSIFDDETEAIQFLFQSEILQRNIPCPACHHTPMALYGKKWRCNKKLAERAFRFSQGPFFLNRNCK